MLQQYYKNGLENFEILHNHVKNEQISIINTHNDANNVLKVKLNLHHASAKNGQEKQNGLVSKFRIFFSEAYAIFV